MPLGLRGWCVMPIPPCGRSARARAIDRAELLAALLSAYDELPADARPFAELMELIGRSIRPRIVTIPRLTDDQRIEEIARMMGGAHVTQGCFGLAIGGTRAGCLRWRLRSLRHALSRKRLDALTDRAKSLGAAGLLLSTTLFFVMPLGQFVRPGFWPPVSPTSSARRWPPPAAWS